jgi:hypothetical protein
MFEYFDVVWQVQSPFSFVLLGYVRCQSTEVLSNIHNYLRLLAYECFALALKTVLPDLLDDNIKPALLHGDLWSGNIISGKNHPYFIDSASYYGHRRYCQ